MKYICKRNSFQSISFAALLFLLFLSGRAQERRTEIAAVLARPFSFIKYKGTVQGVYANGNGISAGLRYSYYLNKGLSIGIGAEYNSYESDFEVSSLSGSYRALDSENEDFQFRYQASVLRERQQFGFLNIPAEIQFETSGKTKLYLGAGFKIGWAVKGKFETKIQNLTTSGYYPEYNAELFSPSFAGFASTDNVRSEKDDIGLKAVYSAVFETGVKQLIGDHNSVYIGVYLDYGLNNLVRNNESRNTVQYNPGIPVKLNYSSILNSSLVRDAILVSYGIKVRYAVLR